MFNVQRVSFDDQGRPGQISVGNVTDKVVIVLPPDTDGTAGLTAGQARELSALLDAKADEIGKQFSNTL